MEYNKKLFRKANDKKVLHKIKKHWVVVSAALLMAIGGRALTVHTAHADVNNNQSSTLKGRINDSLNHLQISQPRPTGSATQQITQQADVLHNRIIQNAGRISVASQKTPQRDSQESANSAVAQQSQEQSSAKHQNVTVPHLPKVNDNLSEPTVITSGQWTPGGKNSAYYSLDSNGKLTISNDGNSGDSDITNSWPAYLNGRDVDFNRNLRPRIKQIDFDSPISLPDHSAAGLFAHMPNLTAVDDLYQLKTSDVTDMSNMFTDDPNLQNLDLSQLNLSSVENMSNMFNYDPNLKTVTFSGTSGTQQANNLSDISGLFSGDQNLTGFTPFQIGLDSRPISDLDLSSAFVSDQNLAQLNLSNWYLKNPMMSDAFYNDRKLGNLNIVNLYNSDSLFTSDDQAFAHTLLSSDQNPEKQTVQITLNRNACFDVSAGLDGYWMSTDPKYQSDPTYEPPRQLDSPTTDLGPNKSAYNYGNVTWQKVDRNSRAQNITVTNQAGTPVNVIGTPDGQKGSATIYRPLIDDGHKYGDKNYKTPYSDNPVSYINPTQLIDLSNQPGYQLPSIGENTQIKALFSGKIYDNSNFEKANFKPKNGTVVHVVGKPETQTMKVDVHEDNNGPDGGNNNPYSISVSGNYGDLNDTVSANDWYGKGAAGSAGKLPTGYQLEDGQGDVDSKGNLHFNFDQPIYTPANKQPDQGGYASDQNAGYDHADGQAYTQADLNNNPHHDVSVDYTADPYTLNVIYYDKSDGVTALNQNMTTSYHSNVTLPSVPAGFASDTNDNKNNEKRHANTQYQITSSDLDSNGNLKPIKLQVKGYPEKVPVEFVDQNGNRVGNVQSASGQVGQIISLNQFTTPRGYTLNTGQSDNYTIRYSDLKDKNPSNEPLKNSGTANTVIRYVTGDPVQVNISYTKDGTPVGSGTTYGDVGDSVSLISNLASGGIPSRDLMIDGDTVHGQQPSDYTIHNTDLSGTKTSAGKWNVDLTVKVRPDQQILTVNYVDLKHHNLLDSRQQEVSDGSTVYLQHRDMTSSSNVNDNSDLFTDSADQYSDTGSYPNHNNAAALKGYQFAKYSDYSKSPNINGYFKDDPLTESDFNDQYKVNMNASGKYPTLTVYMIGKPTTVNVKYFDPAHPKYNLGSDTVSKSNPQTVTGDTVDLPGADADNSNDAKGLADGYYVASDQATNYRIVPPADAPSNVKVSGQSDSYADIYLQVVGDSFSDSEVPVSVLNVDSKGNPQAYTDSSGRLHTDGIHEVYVPVNGRVGDQYPFTSQTFSGFIPPTYQLASSYNGNSYANVDYGINITANDVQNNKVNSDSWYQSDGQGDHTPLDQSTAYWDKTNHRPLVVLQAMPSMPIDFYFVNQHGNAIGSVTSNNGNSDYGNFITPSTYFTSSKGRSQLPAGYSYVPQKSDSTPLMYSGNQEIRYRIHVQGNPQRFTVQYKDGNNVVKKYQITNNNVSSSDVTHVGDVISLTDRYPIPQGYKLDPNDRNKTLYTVKYNQAADSNPSAETVTLPVQSSSTNFTQYGYWVKIEDPQGNSISDTPTEWFTNVNNLKTGSNRTINVPYPNNNDQTHYKLIAGPSTLTLQNKGGTELVNVNNGNQNVGGTNTKPLITFQAQPNVAPITVNYINQNKQSIYSGKIQNTSNSNQYYYNENISDVENEVPLPSNLADAYVEDGLTQGNGHTQNLNATFGNQPQEVDIYMQGKMVNKMVPIAILNIGKTHIKQSILNTIKSQNMTVPQVQQYILQQLSNGGVNSIASDVKNSDHYQSPIQGAGKYVKDPSNSKYEIYNGYHFANVPFIGAVGDQITLNSNYFAGYLPVDQYELAQTGNDYNGANYQGQNYTATITPSDYSDSGDYNFSDSWLKQSNSNNNLGSDYWTKIEYGKGNKASYPLVVLQGYPNRTINFKFFDQNNRQIANIPVNDGVVGEKMHTTPTVGDNLNPYLALVPNGYEYDTKGNGFDQPNVKGNSFTTFNSTPIDDDIAIKGRPEDVYVEYDFNGHKLPISSSATAASDSILSQGVQSGNYKGDMQLYAHSDGQGNQSPIRVGDKVEIPTTCLPAGYRLDNGQNTDYVVNYRDVSSSDKNTQDNYAVDNDWIKSGISSKAQKAIQQYADRGYHGKILYKVNLVSCSRTLQLNYVDQHGVPVGHISVAGTAGNTINLSKLPGNLGKYYRFESQSNNHGINSNNSSYKFDQSQFDTSNNRNGYMYSDTVHLTGDSEKVPVEYVDQNGNQVTVNSSNQKVSSDLGIHHIGDTINDLKIPQDYSLAEGQSSQYTLTPENVDPNQAGQMQTYQVHLKGNAITPNNPTNKRNMVTVNLHYEDSHGNPINEAKAYDYEDVNIGSDYSVSPWTYLPSDYKLDISNGQDQTVIGSMKADGSLTSPSVNFYYEATNSASSDVQPITVNYFDHGYLVKTGQVGDKQNNYVGQVINDVTTSPNPNINLPQHYELVPGEQQNVRAVFGKAPQSMDLNIQDATPINYTFTITQVEKDNHGNILNVINSPETISLKDVSYQTAIKPSQYQPNGFKATSSDQPVTVTATPQSLSPSSTTWNYQAIPNGQNGSINQPIWFQYAYKDFSDQLQNVGGPYEVNGNLNSDFDLPNYSKTDGVPSGYNLNNSDQTNYTITDQPQGSQQHPIDLMVHPTGSYRPFQLTIRVLGPSGSADANKKIYSDVTKTVPITVNANKTVQSISANQNYPSHPSGNDQQDYTFDPTATQAATPAYDNATGSIRVTNNPTGLSSSSGILVFRSKIKQSDSNLKPITVHYLDQNGQPVSYLNNTNQQITAVKSVINSNNYEGQQVDVRSLLSTPSGFILEPDQKYNYTFGNQPQDAYLYVYGQSDQPQEKGGSDDMATINVHEEDPSGNQLGNSYQMKVPVHGQIDDHYEIDASDFVPNGFSVDTGSDNNTHTQTKDQPIKGQIAARSDGTSYLKGATSTTFYYKSTASNQNIGKINVTFKNDLDNQTVDTETLSSGQYVGQVVSDVTSGLMNATPLNYYTIDNPQNRSGVYQSGQDDNVTIMVTPKNSNNNLGGHSYSRTFDQIIQYYDMDGTTLQKTEIKTVPVNGVDGTSDSIQAPTPSNGYSAESDYSKPIGVRVTQNGLMSTSARTDNTVVPENSAIYKYKADSNPSNLGSITVNYWDDGNNVGSGTINNDYASKNKKNFYINENFSVNDLEQLIPLDSNYLIDNSQNQSYSMPKSSNIVANIQVHGKPVIPKPGTNVANLTLVLENSAGDRIDTISRPVTVDGVPGQNYDISPSSFTPTNFAHNFEVDPNKSNNDLIGTIQADGSINHKAQTFYYLATDQGEAAQPITVDYLDHGVLVNTSAINPSTNPIQQLGDQVPNDNVVKCGTWKPSDNGYTVDSNQTLSANFTDRPQTINVQIHHTDPQTHTFQIIVKLEDPNGNAANNDSDEYIRYVPDEITQSDGKSQTINPSDIKIDGYTLDSNDQTPFKVYTGANGLYRSDKAFPDAGKSLLTDNPIVLHYRAKSSQNVQPNQTSDAQPIYLTYKDNDNGKLISNKNNMRIDGYTGQYIDVTNPQDGGIAIPSGYKLAANQNVIYKIGTGVQNVTVLLNETKSGPSNLDLDIVKEGLNGNGVNGQYSIQVPAPANSHVGDVFPVYPERFDSKNNQLGKNYQPAGYHLDTSAAHYASDQEFNDTIQANGLSYPSHTFYYAPSLTGHDGVSNIMVHYYDDRTHNPLGVNAVSGQMNQTFNVSQLGTDGLPSGYAVDSDQNQVYTIGTKQVDADVLVHGNPATNQKNADQATISIYEEDPYGNIMPGYPIKVNNVITGNVGDKYTITADDYLPNGFNLDQSKANGKSGDSDLVGYIQQDGSINNKNVSFYYRMPNSQENANHKIHVIYENVIDSQIIKSDQIQASPANQDYNGKLVNVTADNNSDNRQSPVPAGYEIDPNQDTRAAFSSIGDTYITVKVHSTGSKVYSDAFDYVEPIFDGNQLVNTRIVPAAKVSGADGNQFTVGAPSLPVGYTWQNSNEAKQTTTGHIEGNHLSIDHATYNLEATKSNNLTAKNSDRNAHPIYVTFKDGNQIISDANQTVNGYMNQVIDVLGDHGVTLPKGYRLANDVQQRFYTIGLQNQYPEIQVVPATAENATLVYRDKSTNRMVAQSSINANVNTPMSSLYPKYQSLLPYGYQFVSVNRQNPSVLEDNGQYVIYVQKLKNNKGLPVRVQPNPVLRKNYGWINVTYEDGAGHSLATYNLTASDGTKFSLNNYVGGSRMPKVFNNPIVDRTTLKNKKAPQFIKDQTQSVVIKVSQSQVKTATAHVEYVNASNGQLIKGQSNQLLSFNLTGQSGMPINYDAYTQFLPQGYSYDGMGNHDAVIEDGDTDVVLVRPDRYRKSLGYMRINYYDTQSKRTVDSLVLPGRDGQPFDIGYYENNLPYMNDGSDQLYAYKGISSPIYNRYQGGVLHDMTVDIGPSTKPASNYGQITIHFIEADHVNPSTNKQSGQTEITGDDGHQYWVTSVSGSQDEILSGRIGDVFSPETYEYNTPVDTQFARIIRGNNLAEFTAEPQDVYIAVNSTKGSF